MRLLVLVLVALGLHMPAYADSRDICVTEMQDYEKRIVACTEVIKNWDSENIVEITESYINRGVAFLNTGRPKKALADFNDGIDEALKFDPEMFSIVRPEASLRQRGRAYSATGQYAAAIPDYTVWLEDNPGDPDALDRRGTAYLKLNQPDKALADFNAAIKLVSKDAILYNNRGAAYLNLGQVDKAIADFDKAISLNPKFARAFANRGEAYEKKGDMPRARADYMRAEVYKK